MAVLGNHHAFEPCQIRDHSACEALGRLFARHHNVILETGVPSFADLNARRAVEPRFRATLLTAALLAPAICPFYRNRPSIDFLHPIGLLRARGDRNFVDAILILNKTCDSTLAGRTLSLIPLIQGIAGRLGATLKARRSELTIGDPRAPTDTAQGLITRCSVAYDSPNHVARGRIMYRLQDFMPHVEDLSTSLARLVVTHHGPGFRGNCELIAAYARTMRCLTIRAQLPRLKDLRPGGNIHWLR